MASPKEALQTHKHQNWHLLNGSKAEAGPPADTEGRYDGLVSRLLEQGGWPGKLLASMGAARLHGKDASSGRRTRNAEQALLVCPSPW